MSTSKNFLPEFHLAETPARGRNKIRCQVRGHDVRATPEERIRQRVLHWLINSKKWEIESIKLERAQAQAYQWESDANRRYIRPDIELLDENCKVLVVIECKHEEVPLSDAVEKQAIEYAIKSRARYIWVTNGGEHKFFVPDTKHGGWKAVSSIAPLGETYEPPTGRVLFPDVQDTADVERYLKEMGLNNLKFSDERDFTLALYKVIFEVVKNKKCMPYSHDGVHLLDYTGVAFHHFSNASGDGYYTRYADFVAATRGRVEGMSVAVNMWWRGGIRLCIGVSKAERKHHALQLDFAKNCRWNEELQSWRVYHDGRMNQVKNDVVLEAVRESGCSHWIKTCDDNKEWVFLGDLPKVESVSWRNSKKFLANLLHYGIIRTNLREARSKRRESRG